MSTITEFINYINTPEKIGAIENMQSCHRNSDELLPKK